MNNLNEILRRLQTTYGAFPGSEAERQMSRHLYFENIYETRKEAGGLDGVYKSLRSETNQDLPQDFFDYLQAHAVQLQKGIFLEMKTHGETNTVWMDELAEIRASRIWEEGFGKRLPAKKTPEVKARIELLSKSTNPELTASKECSFEQMPIENWRLHLNELTVPLIFYIINRELTEDLVAGLTKSPV